jgi:outer membrane protein assembly factor BamB
MMADRYSRITLLVFLLVLPTRARSATAADWPRFRGPNGTGHGQGDAIPIAWTDSDHNWRITLAGPGSSSPVVIDDRIFVTSATNGTNRIVVQCFKTSNGSLLWQQTYDSGDRHRYKYTSVAISTPTADREHVYISLPSRERYRVVALDHSGKEKWRHDLPGLRTDHGGGGGSLIIHDGMLIAACDHQEPNSYAAALDCATGRLRWKTPRASGGEATYATPCIYQPVEGPAQLILSSYKCGMTSLDPHSGKMNWELTGIYDRRCVGSVLVHAPDAGPHLLYGTCGGAGGTKPCTLVAVAPGDPMAGTEPGLVYSLKNRYIPYVPTGLVTGELLVLPDDSGYVTCVQATTGKTLWRQGLKGRLYSSPVLIGDRIYFATRQGKMVVLAAADTYKLLGTSNLGETCDATPAVAGGVLYVRTRTHLLSVGGKK